MPVRIIKKEELLECEKVQSIAFAYSMDTAELEKKLSEEPYPDAPYIGFFNDDNIITACMELPEYKVYYEGTQVPMTGIGGVASLPEYRFEGAVREILKTTLQQMSVNGAVFSSLYPFSHAYYRKFGYELCQMSTEYDLPIETLSKFRYTGKAHMVRPGDCIDELKSVFAAHFQRYNMSICREDRHWENLLGKDTYKDRIYTYLLENENGPSAYIVLAAEDTDQDQKIGIVREIAFTHPQGLSDALGFLYRLAAQYAAVRIPLPDDIPLSSLIDECSTVKTRYCNQQMTRIIDVRKALELKPHFDGAAYTLHIHDDYIPENDGIFCVRCEHDIVSVQKLENADSVDLIIDIRTLAQLVLGFLSIDEAKYKKDVQVAGNLEVLRRVFVKRHVYLTDHF